MGYEPQELHLEEFRQVKSEVSALLARVEALVRYAVLITAAIYSWLIVSSFDYDRNGICYKIAREMISYGSYIPIVLSLLFALLIGVTYMHIVVMGKYLKKIEDFLGVTGLGWEDHWKSKPRVVIPAMAFFVIVLLVADTFAVTELAKSVDQSHVCTRSK